MHPPLEYHELSVHILRLRKPARLLHVTDTHFGQYGRHSWFPFENQQELVERIVGLANDPDGYFNALLFTGDIGTNIRDIPPLTSFFTTSKDTLTDVMESFSQVTIPKFATLGNHDTYSDTTEEILRDVGFQMLEPGQNHPVITNLGQLSIWALPDLETQKDWHDQICKNIAAFKCGIDPDTVPIILAHNPDSFDELTYDSFYFGVAGHTHGGGYINPKLQKLALAKMKLKNKLYRAGFIQNGNGAAFIVSEGGGRHTGTPRSDISTKITAIDLLPFNYRDSFHKL